MHKISTVLYSVAAIYYSHVCLILFDKSQVVMSNSMLELV